MKISFQSRYFVAACVLAGVSLVSQAQAQTENKALTSITKEQCPPAEPKDPSVWDKSFLFGLNLTSGNSSTSLLNGKVALSRDYENNVWDFSLGGAFAQQESDDTGKDETTQQTVNSSLSYKRIFDERYYGLAGVKYLYDDIADIDYRVMLKPGVGRYLIKDDILKLSIESGPGYVFEKVGDDERNFFAPFVGERVDWQITNTSKLFQTVEVLFDTADSSNVIMNGEVGIEAAINSTLSLVVSVLDNYTGVPAEGKKRNDLTLGTALKVALW